MKQTGCMLFSLLFSSVFLHAQSGDQYVIRTVAFYNVENLFDTINDPKTLDDERTPEGKDKWTQERYHDKLKKIAKVISEIGAEVTGSFPDIIGLCEIENYTVLHDLTTKTVLSKAHYGIIHIDSPDRRGIDVALLYKKAVFSPTHFKNYPLYLYEADGNRNYTRDQLLVSGMLDNEKIRFIINHWPSRSGGEARSKHKREAAALLNTEIIASIKEKDSEAKVLSMGDFNDDPTSSSLKKVLKTKGKKNKLKKGGLYNPMEMMARKGYGSLAYRDSWNLFDQIFFTATLLKSGTPGYHYWKAGIFNPRYLQTPSGRYKGYPFRSYAGGSYIGGYSDHFPVYVYLIKKIDQ